MSSSRINKIMSAVFPEQEIQNGYRNRMCNVPLSPKKIIIGPECLHEQQTKSDSCYEEDVKEADLPVDNIESSSNISSPPPMDDIPDFEIYTPPSVIDMSDIESVMDDSDTDPTYDPKQEFKRSGRRFRSLLTDSSGSSKNSSLKTPSSTEKPMRKRLILHDNILLRGPHETFHSTTGRSRSRSPSNGVHNDLSISKNHYVEKNGDNILLKGTNDTSNLNSLSTTGAVEKIIPDKKEDVNTRTETKNSDSLPGTEIAINCSESSNLDEMNKNLDVSHDNSKVSSSKYKRKPDYCYFCEDQVLNFARHIQRNHSSESEVARIMALDPKCRERKDLISKLRKRGNFIRNSQGFYKPVRSTMKDRNLLPCSNCLGFYSSKLLYRHRKKCDVLAKGSAQSCGQNTLINTINRIDARLKNEVFPRMQPDKISMEAKRDHLICAFGAQYLKIHREKHFINVTSRKMRELSRLLLTLKQKEPKIIDLFEALQPKYFNLIVDSVKCVAKYDHLNDLYKSPTYAKNIGTSLKQCCDLAIRYNLTDQFSVSKAETEVNLKNMIHLFTSSWKFEISSQAGTDLNLQKWNKITIVPLAEDLKLLKQYLISKANIAVSSLGSNSHDKEAFKVLLETIYCRIILLNRKRPGELQRLLLHTYQSCVAKDGNRQYEEFDPIVTTTEKALLKNFKRVVIRGKRGRGVAVLFSKDVQEHIEVLLSVRKNVVDYRNPYLFGRPGLLTPIIGYKVLQEYARASGAKNPSAITCTKLRKHLATLSQLFSLNETEVDQLAAFMGHTIGVHKNSYRLPDDLHQTAKISKLLLLLEGGNLENYKGKTLDEIDVNLDENLLNPTNESDENSNSDDESQPQLNFTHIEPAVEQIENIDALASKNDKTFNTNRKKRTLVKWTTEQKIIVKKFFRKHIRNKIPPKKGECEELRSQYPQILENKDWLKIKVFIQNIYSKKQKDDSDTE